MHTIQKAAATWIAALTLCACGGSGSDSGSGDVSNGVGTSPPAMATPISVAGSGVKGPLVNATVTAYAVNATAPDLRGATLGAGSTDTTAKITGLNVADDSTGLVLVEFRVTDDTIDMASGAAPIYRRLVTVVTADYLLSGLPVYATPLTTMAVGLAQQKADTGLPYAGDGDGVISESELLAALHVAGGQITSTLGFGLARSVDIFTTPPLITTTTDTPAEQADTAAYRQANEALAATTVYIADNSTADDPAESVLDAIVVDLGDGLIDGSGPDGAIEVLAALDQPIDQTLQMLDPASLMVPGTNTPIADIEALLVSEKATTGEETDTSAIENGAVTVAPTPAILVSDIDGDGVPDTEDAFPENPIESTDSDGDGVGDNGDLFPQDPTESADADGDQVGDNADAFPNDPTETMDRDADGVGDNADAFPTDPTETADTDGDQVGDNADAFPNDPNETVDTDADGVGDNTDVFPNNPDESRDRDGDGVGDNGDVYPDDPERSALSSVTVNLWIGPAQTDITFEGPVTGTDHYRFTNPDCVLNNYALCANSEMSLLIEGVGVSDQATRTSRDAFHRFVNNGRVAELDVGINRWGKRSEFGLVEFKDRIWVIGGFDDVYEGDDDNNGESGENGSTSTEFDGWRANDVWSSQDGDIWVRHIERAPFSSRAKHAVAVFQDQLWVVGGDDLNDTFLSDVWTSPDGVNWTQVTAAAPFGGRQMHRLLNYDGKLWLIGGTTDGFQETNDVWFTEDGINWTQATGNAAWAPNTYVGAVVFDNALWVIGGGGLYDGVWHSTDGVEWVNVPNANFPPRNVYGITVWNNKIWVAGGFSNGGYLNDLWVSADGETFEEVSRTEGHFWWRRTRVGMIGFNDRLWLMGGSRAGDYGDVHSTVDGTDWRWHSFGPTAKPQRSGHEFVVFNDDFYAITGGTYHVDQSIWRSSDGLDWQQVTATAPFGRRDNPAAAVFNGRLWVVAGRHTDGTGWRNDVWSTEDGESWTLERANAAFAPRERHKLIVWNGQLWMIGGSAGADDFSGEVWSTSDGLNWNLVSADAGYGERSDFSVVAYAGRLFVIGGSNFPDRFTDVWSTADGVNWRLDTDALPLSTDSGSAYSAVVYNDQIHLIGGNVYRREANHVFSSSNGTDWVRTVADIGITRRIGFGLAVKDGYLWLNGGHYSDGLAYSQSDTWRTMNLTDWQVGLRRTVDFPTLP
ncbi:MAG: hypothetical protein AAGC71_12940 [Pseudomonadota bacterium]